MPSPQGITYVAEGGRQAHANIHKENIKNELPTLTHMRNMCQSRREISRSCQMYMYLCTKNPFLCIHVYNSFSFSKGLPVEKTQRERRDLAGTLVYENTI